MRADQGMIPTVNAVATLGSTVSHHVGTDRIDGIQYTWHRRRESEQLILKDTDQDRIQMTISSGN